MTEDGILSNSILPGPLFLHTYTAANTFQHPSIQLASQMESLIIKLQEHSDPELQEMSLTDHISSSSPSVAEELNPSMSGKLCCPFHS